MSVSSLSSGADARERRLRQRKVYLPRGVLLAAFGVRPLLTNLLVGGCVEEAVEFGRVSKFNLDDPVLISILVDELGLAFESAIDLEDGAADGRVEVAGSLHALHGAKLFALANLFTL